MVDKIVYIPVDEFVTLLRKYGILAATDKTAIDAIGSECGTFYYKKLVDKND